MEAELLLVVGVDAGELSLLGGSLRRLGGGHLGNLQLDGVVLDRDGERLDRLVGGEGLRPTGREVEQRAVAWALDGTGVGVELALGERAVVVRAAVLDRVERAVAVEDADLDPVVASTSFISPLGSSLAAQTSICSFVLSVTLFLLRESDFSDHGGRARIRTAARVPPTQDEPLRGGISLFGRVTLARIGSE